MENFCKSLDKCPLFSEIKNIDKVKLLSSISYRIVKLKRKEILFNSFDKSECIGIVLSGSIDIQKIFPDGKLIIIERVKASNLVAEESIFADYPYYPSTYCAGEDTEVLVIHKTEILNIFMSYPKVMNNYLREVSNSNLLLKHRVAIMSMDSILEKIAGYLLYDFKINNRNIVSLPFSKKEWAEYMDISRTSLSRELKKMEDRGLIEFEDLTIKILDIEGINAVIAK